MRAGLGAGVPKKALVVALTLGALASALAACGKPVGSATATDVAWVATGASVSLPGMGVTPVNLGRRLVEAQVPVGSLPAALAYTAGDAGLLVVTQGDDTLHEINPATHDVVHSVGVGVEPDAVAVAPGGTRGQGLALVANLDSDTVTPVDLGTWRAERPIPVGKLPVAIAVGTPGPSGAPGTATAFVADFGSNQVTPIALPSLTAETPIAVGSEPQAIAATPGHVLVGNFGDHSLTNVVNTDLRPLSTIPLPLNPTGIAVSPSGTTAYVCGGAGVVSVGLAGLALTVGTPIALPDVAQGIALSPDGTEAWVTQQRGSIVGVTLSTSAVGTPIHVGGHPSAIVIGAG
jgi:DNA-binding beta-propeller fold protein YncE